MKSYFIKPMLTGQELVAFVKANPDMDQTELARAAGYVHTTDKGNERLLTKQMCEALLSAKGVKLKQSRKPGKVAQFTTTVHRNGSILVGKIYSREFGLDYGDELKILIEEDCIKLVPIAPNN
jgi:hypothetical protein